MHKLLLTMAVALACAPAASLAQTPSQVPAYGPDKTIPAPHIAKKKLANGLEVWVVPRQGLPRVDYVLAVRGAGYAADGPAQSGFASMLAGLLNEGTAKRDSRAVAEMAQGLGGAVGASSSQDGITVFANALTSNAAPMLTLLAEVARQPAFPAAEVALAKANALQALKVAETTPRFRAERALSKAIYGDHPYGNSDPTEAAINGATDALLRAEHAKRFRPERSLLVITGRIKEADAMKYAQAAFGDWKGQGAAVPETAPAPAAAAPVRILLEREGSVQSTLRLGRPGIAASTADYVPLRLTSTVLGGGFSSRVNLNLREEKGYTYGASAGGRSLRDGGAIIGGADVRNEVTGAALGEYFKEYRKLGTELVSDEEMRMNKRYVAGTYLLTNQMQRAVASTLANNWLVGLPAEFLGQYVPLIEKVTPEQVRDIGRKYFSPESQSIVIVGDGKAIAEQLKQFGDFKAAPK